MKCRIYVAILVFLIMIAALTGVTRQAKAAIPAIYTNENFWTSEHDRPVFFTRDQWGNFFGITQTGKTFEQRIIENTLSIRLQRFTIDEASYYISDRGIITAPTNTVALSIYLARTS